MFGLHGDGVAWRWLGLCMLGFFLSTGCGPKAVTPPVEPVRPVEPERPSISEILMQQYAIWRGVPYRFGGRSRAGVDCSGLMQIVFRDGFGLKLPRTSIEQSHVGVPVSRLEIRPGDLLFFSTRSSDHIGVAMDAQRFFQASTSQGVVITELEAYWWPRLRRVRRVLEENRYMAAVTQTCVAFYSPYAKKPLWH